MTVDTLTFFFGFTCIFGALGAYMWRLDRVGVRLAERLAKLESKDS